MTPSTTITAATLTSDQVPALRRGAPIAAPEAKAAEVPPAAADGPPPTIVPPAQHPWRRSALIGIAALISIVAGVAYYVEEVLPYESTDDAFIEAHVTPIAPQIAGRVVSLLVADNQEVHQGELLLQIDPRDAQAQLDQARAGLDAAQSRLVQATAQLKVDQARVAQETAGITAASAEALRAETDAKRYQAISRTAISESQLDFVASQAHASAAQVQVARSKTLAAEAQLDLSHAGIRTAEAEVAHAAAVVRTAELELSYTSVTAPEAGLVTHRTVEAGAYVQVGQALLAIVPRQVWVIANFKETQLAHMRAGQAVTVSIDAYPDRTFTGHVDSIQSGSGPRFSLLPPENASGNYVKVVQRLPVKIALDGTWDPALVLGPGMSVIPEVRVR
jgi:membrane fusion protein (multidrug efflux system)